MQRLTGESFDAALREFDHLVVNFTADWCPDCRRIKDAYAAFPQRFPQLHFAVVDTEASPDLAARFEVRGIPSLLVFRGGKLVDRLYSRDAKTVRQVEDFVAKQVAGFSLIWGAGRETRRRMRAWNWESTPSWRRRPTR